MDSETFEKVAVAIVDLLPSVSQLLTNVPTKVSTSVACGTALGVGVGVGAGVVLGVAAADVSVVVLPLPQATNTDNARILSVAFVVV